MRSGGNLRTTVGAAVAVLLLGAPAKSEDLCSTEKVNHSCTVYVDRVNPLQPPTLQMYPGSAVTVRIENALPFEQLSLDWTSSTGTQLTTDPFSAIFNAFSGNLQKLIISTNTPQPGPMARIVRAAASVDACETVANDDQAQKCAAQLADDAKLAITDIGPLVNDDTVVFDPDNKKTPALTSAADYSTVRQRILCRVLGSTGQTAVTCPKDAVPPYYDLVAGQQRLSAYATKPNVGADIPALSNYTSGLISALENVAQDLIALDIQPASGVLGTIVDPVRRDNSAEKRCNSSKSTAPTSSFYERLVQRQVSCAVNVFNLVANSNGAIPAASQKRAIVTITANFFDTHIEASAGILISALPSRSFAAVSAYSGMPPTVSGITVQEKDTRPLIVPYGAANFRLGNDWLWPDRRRGAVYATILAGVNPNTTTADFGAGISLSWRMLVVSPVAHFTHDVRLTGGFTNGESLGTSFSGTVPTQQFWTTTFGLGIGVRVPLITGR